ncbi:NADH-quinone oxidoreductase subunit NuoF [Desulfitibacter alkalitolerans]|uniref:NADH-quinone oxidoreductase subunit NuoF n=1 Tax=Desulfitibacter alkalitolerans TaxID=264641 RepID=UPI00048171FE|nr:NADH-quinone oxidoreductase subunit NuoF [Desulfitibacter alkalitolerans]
MDKKRILICAGTGCVSSGSNKVEAKLKETIKEKGLQDDVQVVITGCHGFCEQGPLLIVEPEDLFYCRVEETDIDEIVDKTLVNNEVIDRLLFEDPQKKEKAKTFHDIDFYNKQQRLVLKNCGHINPENIDEYLAQDGYAALEKVLKNMNQVEVIEEVKKSGLRGRGGGGFSTGLKWEFTYKAQGDKKYVVCNADEGDPGAFMDRSLLEGDPHIIIEGMLICGYAIGADEGYVYVRAEYPLAIKRLQRAISQAEERGYLGTNILGTNFSFKLNIKAGAGAFVCGEETALLISIEGNRGMPKVRPPYPATKGLWDKPTTINNVETFGNIPVIFRKGAEWFAGIGTEKSKGTKVFALTGKVNNTGLVEVPMGISIRKIIFDIGGGIKDNGQFKAVQIGGPSGGCIPSELLDLPVDYDSLTQAGAMMGSGGLVIMDEKTCMVDLSRFFLNFTQKESCGKCTPCREGTKRMLEILIRITEGAGVPEDIEILKKLGENIKKTSLCGLGQTAPNPVLSTLRYFEDEYWAHIKDKKCPAGACKELVTYRINPDLCNGCTLCARSCPVNAITGEKKEIHFIDPDKCTRCGVCITKCKKGAIYLA